MTGRWDVHRRGGRWGRAPTGRGSSSAPRRTRRCSSTGRCSSC
jgi:hypothetical protein